jgi:hypothetical protein
MQQQLFPLNEQFKIYTGDTVVVTAQDDEYVYFTLNGQQMYKNYYIFNMMTGGLCKRLYAAGIMQG